MNLDFVKHKSDSTVLVIFLNDREGVLECFSCYLLETIKYCLS